MTKEEAKIILFNEQPHCGKRITFKEEDLYDAFDMAIKALEQEPSISEDGTLIVNVEDGSKVGRVLVCGDNHFGGLYYPEQEPKTWHCKDCKWWKDSDGAYRRGVKAESKCPINRKEVYEGNGYCFLFEPQKNCGAKMVEPQERETWNCIHAQITAPKGTFERIVNDTDDDDDDI